MKKRSIAVGDIRVVGDHIVACGDSGNALFVSSVFKGKRVALTLADVPYGVAYGENKFIKSKVVHAPIMNDHIQSDAEFSAFTKAWLDAVRPHLTRKNAVYAFCSDKMLLAFHNGMIEADFRFGQMLHWLKTASVMGRLDYSPQHETILYFWHGAHEFMKSHDKSVIIHPKPTKNKFHPTEKPIPILRRFILNSSRIGDIVYDPFAGSGTTALACEMTKRCSISIELEPKYCQVIIDRLEKLTGERAQKFPSRTHA